MLLTTAAIALAPSVAIQDPVAHYRFEGGNAGSVAAGVGSVLDSSPNGHHGDPHGDPSYEDSQCAFPASGLLFSQGGGGDYVSFPGEFVFHEGFGDATVEFSIKTTAPADATLLFTNDFSDLDKNRFHLMISNKGELALDYRDESGAITSQQ